MLNVLVMIEAPLVDVDELLKVAILVQKHIFMGRVHVYVVNSSV